MGGDKSKLRKTGAMSRHQKILIGIAIAFLLYSMAGFMVLPVLLKNFLEKKLTENLNRQVTIENIQINPYLIKITVSNFLIKTRNKSENFVGFESLFVDLEAISIIKRALVIKSLALTAPSIHLTRYKDLSYNFSDLTGVKAEEEQEAAGPFLFSLNNIEIINGSIVFADQPKDTTHRVADLNIAVPYLSNIQHEVEIYVQPAFSAIVNDTPTTLTGKTIPFHDSRRTVFDIKIDKLNIPEYLAYFPDLGELTLKSGQLDVAAVIGFEVQPGNTPALTLQGDIALLDINVAEKHGESYLKIPRIDLKLHDSKPLEQDFHLSGITFDKPEFRLSREKDGSILPLALLPQVPEAETSESAGDQETLLKLLVDEIVLHNGTVHFDDRTNSEPFAAVLNPVEIRINRLTTRENEQASYEATLQTEAGENITANGTLSLNPLAAQAHVSLMSLQIPRFRPYYADIITPQVEEGSFSFAGDLQYQTSDDVVKIRAENITSELASLAINDREGKKLLSLPALSISASSVDLDEHRVVIGNLAGSDGELHLTRDKDGIVIVNELFRQQNTETDEPEVGESAPQQEWTATLLRGDLDGFGIIFRDIGLAEPTTIGIDRIRLTAENISTAENSTGPVDLSLRLDKKGKVSIKGPVGIRPLSASLALSLADLPVKSFQPYFADRVNMIVSNGAVSANGQLKMSLADDRMSTRFQGSANVADFSSFDPVANEEFLKWNNLSLGDIDFDSDRSAFRVKDVGWHSFDSRIVVFEDSKTNLQAVLRDSGEPEAVPPEQAPAGEGESFLIEIGTVSLDKGTVDFLDRRITPHYASTLSDLTGTITGLSSRSGVMAAANITGKLDQQAPLRITGRLNPLSDNIYADLVIDFKNIELSPTSPYTGKFIGHKVSKGKLSLDLKYLVEDRKITGKNNAFLDQFTLGDTVESPDDLNLPIGLAIALLRNRRGEITLNVPVKGDLDDPEFSIGGIVFRAIINLIAKAATSPFALLGALIPEGKDLQHIEFPPGSASIGGENEGKLETIAKVLYDRPALKMDIRGSVNDPEERKVLHEMRFTQLLKNEKYKKLSRKKDTAVTMDEITVEPDEYETYLEEAYDEATFDKPKNFIGLTKSQPPEVMEKMLRDNITVTDDDLRLLALERANGVKSYLIEAGPVEPERLFIIEPQTGGGEAGVPQVEMTIK